MDGWPKEIVALNLSILCLVDAINKTHLILFCVKCRLIGHVHGLVIRKQVNFYEQFIHFAEIK